MDPCDKPLQHDHGEEIVLEMASFYAHLGRETTATISATATLLLFLDLVEVWQWDLVFHSMYAGLWQIEVKVKQVLAQHAGPICTCDEVTRCRSSVDGLTADQDLTSH